MSDHPPAIDTPRLLLDAHAPDDIDALAAMWADPRVVAHMGGDARTRQDSWFRLLRYRGLWPIMGYGYWAVREKGCGRFIGDVGFGAFERGLEPSIEGLPEAGWVFASDTHGRGYATEALRAILEWLDFATPHRLAVSLISAGNLASLRVAQKAGFDQAGLATDANGQAMILLRRRAPQ